MKPTFHFGLPSSSFVLSPIIGRFALHLSWKFAAVGLKNYPHGRYRRRPCIMPLGTETGERLRETRARVAEGVAHDAA